MANSKYEYVKSFEVEDEIMLPNIIVVRIDGCDFNSFCEVHGFEKPNNEKALDLMNKCAISVMQWYPDIVFGYGYSDHYSFVTLPSKSTHVANTETLNVTTLVIWQHTLDYLTTNWKRKREKIPF